MLGFLPFLGKAVAGLAGSELVKNAGEAIVGKTIDSVFDRQAEKRAQKYQDPAAIRKRYEAAGFNPLLAFNGNGAGTSMPSVGQSSAASSMIAASLDRDQNRKIATAQLEQENRRLELMARELTLKDPGTRLYSDAGVRDSVGGAIATAAGAADGTPALPGDPDREIPKLETPSTVMLDDGLSAANPEVPTEPEQDLWKWARDGQFFENVGSVIQRNTTDKLVQRPGDLFIPFGRHGRELFTEAFPKSRIQVIPKSQRKPRSSPLSGLGF
jgi:hypothetical protein